MDFAFRVGFFDQSAMGDLYRYQKDKSNTNLKDIDHPFISHLAPSHLKTPNFVKHNSDMKQAEYELKLAITRSKCSHSISICMFAFSLTR